jgi:16S rRNA (cytidine1402-2'-O)-methyltransferase
MSTLYLVGVPIGNWEDITFRAIETLKKVDIIAAEDTRKAKKLLTNFSITPSRLIAHHNANEKTSSNGVVQLLQEGNSVAFISDAGMPGISDPGFLLARTAIEKGVEVEVIPGVSAAPTAVVVSGLPCDRFFFQGFLPRQKSKQQKRLAELNTYAETMIFYESPRRVLDTLNVMIDVFGENRQVCLCRELTKIHEEIIRTSLADLYKLLSERESILGEISLVVAGEKAEPTSQEDIEEYIKLSLSNGVSPKVLKKELAEKLETSAAKAYKIILSFSK